MLLIAVELTLAGMYVVVNNAMGPWRLRPLFDMNAEANIPAWFSSLQLFAIGFVLFLAASSSLRRADGLAGLLRVLGVGFVFLSMDEAAMVHEKVTDVLAGEAWAPRFRDNHGIWMFVYGAVGVALLAAMHRSLWRICRLYPRDVARVGMGLAVLLAGAVGVEVIGYEMGLEGRPTPVLTTYVAIEEFCEMLGASLVLVASLRFALHPATQTVKQPALAQVLAAAPTRSFAAR